MIKIYVIILIIYYLLFRRLLNPFNSEIDMYFYHFMNANKSNDRVAGRITL